ncbi:MAG: helix-turn-helix domain-containing protein [Candidatus Omnitrophota bacterium]
MSESQGERLKKIRQEKGLSLEEVRRKTKVHMNILKALEGDSVSNLNPVYLKSFLKIYCQFLGVDYKEFLREPKEVKLTPLKFIAPKPAAQQNAKKILGITEAAKPGLVSRASLKLGAFKANSRKFKNIFAALFLTAIFFFALFALGKWISTRKRIQPAKAKEKIVAAPRKAEVKKEAKFKEKKPQVAVSIPKNEPAAIKKDSAPGQLTLVIKAKDKCWVDLRADGKTVFRQFLEKGRSDSWKAKEKMILSLSNAANVELQVNERVFTNLGKKGQALKNIVITRDGNLSISR